MIPLVMIRNTWPKLFLLVICATTILLGSLTINRNIDNPNMIVYFNADEGWLMDLAWSLYSGEKRESYQGDWDVGIGLLYLTDFFRSGLFNFVAITPTTLVLILRWFYLLSLVGSFLALWRLASFHFGNNWQPLLAVALLAVRPVFTCLSTNLKADPFTLLLVIVGLDYTLRIIDGANQKRNLYIAIGCAALAFVVKYTGIFLLPAIIAALYFSGNRRANSISWLFPAFFGLAMIILPLLTIFLYVRKSTGFTWYVQFGFIGSLTRNVPILLICLTGLVFVFMSPVIWILGIMNNRPLKRVLRWVGEVNTNALKVCSIFFLACLVFGLRWVITPRYFISSYAQLGPTFFGNQLPAAMAGSGWLNSLIYNIAAKIKGLDPIILGLFIFYLIMEWYIRSRRLESNLANLLKRNVLLAFLIPLLLLTISMGRSVEHHLLPFFVVMSILAVHGFFTFLTTFNNRVILKKWAMLLIVVLFVADILLNGIELVKSRFYEFNKRKDIAYEIDLWWKKHIPLDAVFVADHYIHAYIPQGYKNITVLNWNGEKRIQKFRQFVDAYHPRFVYYNENIPGLEPMPPIGRLLPDKKVMLVKSFGNSEMSYQRYSDTRFFVYEIIY